MALQQDIENFTTTVEDAVSYPILTRETSDYPSYSRNGSSSSTGNGLTATSRTAMQTIRNLLGWRYRTDDPKGFLAALNKTISLKEFEGRVVWDWKPQSYMVQADMGEITGAQASIFKQATVALENALPLLDGLTALRTDADEEDIEAMRAIVRTEMTELVGELGLVGGPRVQRVDSFFEKLIGPLPPASFDPEHVRGQLARLRNRFGLIRARVNTIAEEQTLTNFLILVDYLNSLYQSWDSKRRFFNGTAEPFLGTQLVLISEVLDAILEQLQETYEAMDSVFFGPAERQTAEINLTDGPMTVTEILSWVESFAAVEGRQLIQEGGKDGVVVFTSTMVRLRDIVQEATNIALQPSTNPVRPFHTRRVALSLGELASYLSTGVDRASEISRRTFQIEERLGQEENQWWLKSALIPPGLLTRVDHFDWYEYLPKHGNQWVTRQPGNLIFPGYQLRIALWGFFPSPPLSLEFDSDIAVEEIHYDRSKKKVVARVRVSENAAIGPRSLFVEDCEQQKLTMKDVLFVAAPRGQKRAAAGIKVSSMNPRCGHQGDTKHIRFEGDELAGCGVCFGCDDDIRTRGTTYAHNGTWMDVEIAISRRARIGEYVVELFASDNRSLTLEQPFEVFAAVEAPLARFEVTPARDPVNPCAEEPSPRPPYEAPSDEHKTSAGEIDPTAKPGPSPEETLKDAPATVQAAAKSAEITGITDYQICQVENAPESRKPQVRVKLTEDKEIASAWLVYSGTPTNTIGPGKVTKSGAQATILFPPSADAPAGPYDLVIFMSDKSVEHAVSSVIVKAQPNHATS